MRQGMINFFSLFTSTGTLLCCALPSLLVALGAGAAVASLWTLPGAAWLIKLSHYKLYLFIFAGLMIGLNFALVYRPRSKAACTVGEGEACAQASRFNKVVLWLSAGIYAIGLFGAYLALPLRQALDV